MHRLYIAGLPRLLYQQTQGHSINISLPLFQHFLFTLILRGIDQTARFNHQFNQTQSAYTMILPTILLLLAIALPAQNTALSLASSADPAICPPHCLECTDELTCTRCDQANHWKISPDHLCVCGDSFYPSNDTCEPCSLGCLSCTAPSPCLACDTVHHFQLADDLCVCMDTFILSNSVCESCSVLIEGCLRCTSNTTCTVCQDDYDFVYATHNCKEKQDGTIKVVTFSLLGVMVVVGGVLFVGSKLRKDKMETMLEPEEKEEDSEAERSQNEQ